MHVRPLGNEEGTGVSCAVSDVSILSDKNLCMDVKIYQIRLATSMHVDELIHPTSPGPESCTT